MLYAIIAAGVSLYVLWTVACWRMAEYFCVRNRWLLLVPGVNLIYFAAISDVVALETHECKMSVCRFVVLALVLVLLGAVVAMNLHQYELIVLAGRILFLNSAVFSILTLCWCYMVILCNSYDYPTLVCLASLVIPFPIWLFIASFTIKGKTEEVVELFWG